MKSDRAILLLLLLVQSFLLVSTFPNAFIEPANFTFCNKSDGLKNSFTLHTYVDQPTVTEGGEPLKLQSMNYPFGEYLLYTDATPIFAGPYRVFANWFPSLKNTAVPAFNFFVLLCFLFTTWVVFKLLKKLHTPIIAAFILAICFAWINPQATRILNGNLNLATSWIIPTLILLFIRWWENRRITDVFLMVLLIVTSCFFHLYYLPILVMLTAAFSFFAAVWDRRWAHVSMGAVVSILSSALVFTAIRLLDGWYTQRSVGAGGYGVETWKLHFDSLYTPYNFFSLQWITKSGKYIAPESYGFLGHFALYGIIVLILGWLWSVFRKEKINVIPNKKVFVILLASIPLLFTALGETMTLFSDSITVPNLLNPFYYLHFITDRVTQFRCLGRFGWPFFWAANLFIVVGLSRFLINRNEFIRYGIWAALLVLVITDARDFQSYANSQQQINYLNESRVTSEWEELFDGVDVTDYQAILPLPYWHVGSEIYTLTLDPEEVWCRQCFQVSVYTGLPLMAVKMSRTSTEQTRAQLSLFDKNGKSDLLMQELNEKPILLFRTTDDNRYFIPDKEPARRYFYSSLNFPDNNETVLLKSNSEYELYSWTPSY